MGATMRYLGKGGHIAGHDVFIKADTIIVLTADGRSVAHPVPNYGTAIHDLARRSGFRLGWARMEDDAEILFFYDRDDDNFGYALNLNYEWCSEWGYAPFA